MVVMTWMTIWSWKQASAGQGWVTTARLAQWELRVLKRMMEEVGVGLLAWAQAEWALAARWLRSHLSLSKTPNQDGWFGANLPLRRRLTVSLHLCEEQS
jgi:hypothetical protein